MTRFFLSILGGLFSLATLGVAFVVLSIGAVFFVYGRDLPTNEEIEAQLGNYTPPTISRIYSGEGRIMGEYLSERRIYTPAEQIPDVVKQAFISAEDKNFYDHQGFDLRGIAAAAVEAVESGGDSLRGASTIPQQIGKIFYFGGDRRFERKIKEIILANRMVNTLPRDKILEIYLNEIDLGFLSFGVAAAAQTYYNKTLSELSPAEAAYLAALPKAPYTYHPVLQTERAVARRNFVLQEMNENGYLTDAAYEEAVAEPLRTVQAGDYEAYEKILPPRDYFTDEIRRQLSRDFGQGEFFGGGLTVRATMDPELQVQAADALRQQLLAYDMGQGKWHGPAATIPEGTDLSDEGAWRDAMAGMNLVRDVPGWSPALVLGIEGGQARIGVEGQETDDDGDWIRAEGMGWVRGNSAPADILNAGDIVYVVRDGGSDDDPQWALRQVPEVQGAFMAMDVTTGRVLAMQGGFSYQHSVFNRATQAERQPGSSFKPFVYAAALDSGFTPATIIIDAPIEVDVGGGEVWRPKNASNRYYGPTPLRTGIERSRNLMTVRLAEEVGMQTVASYAERFGVYDDMQPFLANALGSEETTLYRIVAAYAMFANGGERVEPTLVDRVQDRWGRTIYRHDRRDCFDCDNPDLGPGMTPQIVSNNQRVMNAITAYQLTSMLQGVVERGTAAGAVNLGVPTAGKTGTTNDARDVWFVGFTSNIVAGCYIGYDNPRPLSGGSASGGQLCAPVFQDFMTQAVKKYGGSEFTVPPGGTFIKIDRVTGQRLPDYASGPDVVAEYFRDGEQPTFGVTYDGGFAMGSNLPVYSREETLAPGTVVETADGQQIQVPDRATTSTISSGGLY